jgi:hypothetical protein
MARSIRGTKKSRGRPRTTGPGSQIGMRWQAAELAAIDAWRNKQDGRPSRAEAIRLLVKLALASTIGPTQRSEGSRRKATDMAGNAIDRLGDQSASGEERASRKRRLLSGPKEFRDIRDNQHKTRR